METQTQNGITPTRKTTTSKRARKIANAEKWICVECDREMSFGSKEAHLAGRVHRSSLRKIASQGGVSLVPADDYKDGGRGGGADGALGDSGSLSGARSRAGKPMIGGRGGNSGGSARGSGGPGSSDNGRGGGGPGSGGGRGSGGRGGSGGGPGGGGSGRGGGGGRGGHSGRRRGGGGGGAGGGGGGGSGGGGGGSSSGNRSRQFCISDEDARSILYDIDTAFGLLPHGGAYKESNFYDDNGYIVG